MTSTLTVGLGARSYPIVIGGGLLAEAGERIREATGTRHAVVITDSHVAARHLAPLTSSLDAAGIGHQVITLPPGEATKNWDTLGEVLNTLLDAGIERGSAIVALGGGVVGDLAGFASSIVLRGVPFVQVPTTLLAQVDSSVGGKTGVNTVHGKNLIGSFWQPRLVLADLDTLTTLPARELRAGYAEAVKYGVIDQPEFFTWLEANHTRVLGSDREALTHAVHISCAAKASIVGEDERESGKRALLNLGHTFGHALEAEAGYDGTLLHGEAVAVGMTLALALSVKLGLCPAQDHARLSAHLRACGLPASPRDIRPAWDVDRLMGHLAHDKKVTDGALTFILAHGIGQAFIAKNVDPSSARDVWKAALA